MPSMNTEDEMERWNDVKAWYSSKGDKGVFSSVSKRRTYGQYTFEAVINPDVLEDDMWKSLSSRDILALVDGGPWYFGGKITDRSSKFVRGVVYTD